MNKKSFSLLGVLISIQILIVAVVAIVGLMSSLIIQSRTAGNKIIAMGLAQEGMEIVRNIRDNNWLSGVNWDQNILKSNPPYNVDYQETVFIDSSAENKIFYDSINGYRGKVVSGGQDTIFSRKIYIADNPDLSLKITCIVSWNERGKDYNIELEDWLYNWRQ